MTQTDNPHTSASSPAQDSYKWKALIIVAMGTIMGTMDTSITNISFPILTKAFNVGLPIVMWVSLSFMVTSTSLMLVLGRVGDMIGRKKVFTTGSLIFLLGLIFCSLSPNVYILILSRAFQAIGLSMTVACGTAILTEAFPPEERGKALGLMGISVSLGFIIGPVVGGFLLQIFHWQAIFYLRAPIALLTWFLAVRLLKPDHQTGEKLKIDFGGAITSALALAFLVVGVSLVSHTGLKSPLVIGSLSGSLVSFILFIIIERRVKSPVVDFAIFKNRLFSGSILALLTTFLAYPAFILVMPFYLMSALGYSPLKTGLIMSAVSISTMISGPASGWLSDKYGQVKFSILGAIITAISFILMRTFSIDSNFVTIVPVLMVFGIGVGLFQAPNSSSIMGSVSLDHLGSASALIGTLRSVGIAVGLALAGTIFSIRKAWYLANPETFQVEAAKLQSQAITSSFNDVAIYSTIMMCLTVVVIFVTGRKAGLTEEA